jgi:hypothetical protein
MATINLKFLNKPNDSLKPGDIAFYTSTSVSNSFTVNSGVSTRLGIVRSIKHASELIATEYTSTDNLISTANQLGPELISNNSFDEGIDGWTINLYGGNVGEGWQWDSDGKRLKYDSGAQYSFIYIPVPLSTSNIYKLQLTADSFQTTDRIRFGLGAANGSFFTATTPPHHKDVTSAGVHSIYIKPSAAMQTFVIRSEVATGVMYVDDVSLKVATPDYWVVNVDIPDNTASPAANDYIFFSKSTQANFSGIAGYYGEITFTNNKTSAAELYSINSEVFESSK